MVLLGTTPLKCSCHLALKFFKVVWLKNARFSQIVLSFCIFSQFLKVVPVQKPGLVSGVHSQFAQR